MARASLSGLVADVRGSVNGEVFTRRNGEAVVRSRPKYRFPVTPNQRASNEQFRAVMQAYNGLTHEQAMAWNAFAVTLTRHSPVNGEAYHPTGQNVFVGLARKFVQINPNDPLPLTPPARPFEGDSLTIAATGGIGQVIFTANGPNTSSVQTELLLERLATPRRSPSGKYVSQGFVAFADGALSISLSVSGGFYATANRFVNAATGQKTELIALGVVEVS